AQSYRPGDTASIFVPTPFEGPFQVLMTVERGSFLEVRRFVSEESNPMVELALPPSYAPNVYVSFVVVKGAVEPVGEGGAEHPPDVRVGFVHLTVEPLSQTLDVEVTADQTAPYRPGDEVELTVRTVDVAGQTVDAEVGLAVVDKAVLALMEPYAPSIVEGFYGERPLSVVYGDSSLVLFNRVAANIQDLVEEADRMAAEVALGGMGGGGGGDGLVAPEEVRQSFPDTALWETRIRTGLSGEVQLTFELPDSLTTWVADARAVTADTRVGGDETEIIVSKPLLIRPSTPRFFVAGDRAEVAGVVHNNTPEDLDVTVLLEASGVAVEGEADHTFLLSAGEHQRVTWVVSVPRRGSEEALLTFSVAGGDYEDAARPSVGRPPDGTLPVYRYETPDVMGASGSLTEEGSRVESIVIPPEAGVDTELVLRLEPSLAASMVSGLTYLENSPYNSTEQIVSRFLPNILTYRALRDLGLDEADLEANLEEVVLDGLDRLYGRQNEDGGWGWLPSGRSDLQVSAYVALGLWEAQRAGFTVREGALSRTLDYVSEALAQEQREEPRSWAVEHALAFYVLTLVEEGWPGGVAGSLYAARQDLGATGQAYLALALGKADAADRRVITLLDELRGVAEITASGAHWEDANASSWATGVRATAVVLKAFIELAPDDPLISQSVRWLTIARRGDRWTTTQETVWSLIALTDYMVATGELQANYTWGVALNGVALEEGAVTPDILREVTEFEVGLSEDPAQGLVRGRTN
ncbi:MAG: alpha-2-macroglobulin family protein, partial [Anaerolineae bacterium]